jgi:tetrahydromethanopterin S-methyltransferase subunit G
VSEGANGNDRLERIENAVRSIAEKLETSQKELLTLIENTSQSLQREMQDGFRTVNDRLDRMETRLDLQMES